MKKESMRKYSLLGLVLIAASAVTAAVLPKDEEKRNTGRLVASANGSTPQLTCSRDAVSGAACDWTATEGTGDDGNDGTGSRTTVEGVSSSITITGGGAKAVTRTNSTNGGVGAHTSHN